MKRLITVSTLVLIVALATWISVLLPDWAAAENEPTPTPEQTNAVLIALDILPTPTIEPIPVPTPTPKPTPKPISELPMQEYEGRDVDVRCLSRFFYGFPNDCTDLEKIAGGWVSLNRIGHSSGLFRDDLRGVLMQGDEFRDYDPEARRTEHNTALAEQVLNAWRYEQITGDDSYRLVPKEGVKYAFYDGGDGRTYIRVFDLQGNVVYDSGI